VSFFRVIRNVRLFILLFVGVPILACAGIAAGVEYITGKGSVTVLAPDAGASLTIDGSTGANLPAGERRKVDLAQGKHHLTMTVEGTKAEADVSIPNGFTDLFWGGGADRCFADVDVTHFAYEHSGSQRASIERKFHGDAAVDLPSTVYFTEESLPGSIEDGSHVSLLLEVPCGALELSDADLLEAMGFTETAAK
jgi:hypothetical protein